MMQPAYEQTMDAPVFPVFRYRELLKKSKPQAGKQISKKKKDQPFLTNPYDFFGDPNGNRTHVSGVRGQRPRPLDDGAMKCSVIKKDVYTKKMLLSNTISGKNENDRGNARQDQLSDQGRTLLSCHRE